MRYFKQACFVVGAWLLIVAAVLVANRLESASNHWQMLPPGRHPGVMRYDPATQDWKQNDDVDFVPTFVRK